jgi:hypothetical protein
MPFAMFYGACDLLFAQREVHLTEDHPDDVN